MYSKILKSIELAFRHMIVYPSLNILLANKRHTKTIDLNQVNKLLIFRHDRIGDMIITTPIFRKIKKDYPHLQINVLASPANATVVRHDPNIDKLIIKEANWLKNIRQLFWLREQEFDVLLNFIFNKTTTLGIFARLICPNGIKVSQGPEKYKFYFNHFLTLERGKKHTCELYIELVEKVFGVQFKNSEYRYELTIPRQTASDVHTFLNNISGLVRAYDILKTGYVLLNISAAETEKSLSALQAEKIAHYISQKKKIPLIIISAPWDIDIRHKIIKITDTPYCNSFPEYGNADLSAVAEIINGARFVITPDTSIIHFASAMATPVIGVYTPLKFIEEWYPYGVEHIMVMAKDKKPVSDIPLNLIFREIDKYIHTYFTTGD